MRAVQKLRSVLLSWWILTANYLNKAIRTITGISNFQVINRVFIKTKTSSRSSMNDRVNFQAQSILTIDGNSTLASHLRGTLRWQCKGLLQGSFSQITSSWLFLSRLTVLDEWKAKRNREVQMEMRVLQGTNQSANRALLQIAIDHRLLASPQLANSINSLSPLIIRLPAMLNRTSRSQLSEKTNTRDARVTETVYRVLQTVREAQSLQARTLRTNLISIISTACSLKTL